MNESEIVHRFLDAELCLHPSALQEISRHDNPSEVVERLLGSFDGKGSVITAEDLKNFEVVIRKGGKCPAEEHESEIKIRDLYKESESSGSLEGFVSYFNSRFNKGVGVFKERKHLVDTTAIGHINNLGGSAEVNVIGLVESLRRSKKGNIIINLEDPTGLIPVVVLDSERELVELSRTVVEGDIILVEGVTGSREGGIIIARDISFPDVPISRPTNRKREPLAIAMISDIHVGSYEFMEKEFTRFLKWLNSEIGTSKQQELAKKVKYLLIAGDLVDGVGIYPGQIDDLAIKDIYRQYERFSELLDMVPDYIEIIVSPGNHDATRQAEPQSPIFEDFAQGLYTKPNVHMVGNPCYLTLHNTTVLVYHGRSMDDIISKIPGMSYSKPEKAMLNLVKKRQLAPIFGEKVPVSPGVVDCLFMERVPDILHSGHVHTTGVQCYRGVNIINSGAFQSQTEFQKRLNLQPDPGKVPIYDIENSKTTLMNFL